MSLTILLLIVLGQCSVCENVEANADQACSAGLIQYLGSLAHGGLKEQITLVFVQIGSREIRSNCWQILLLK